jgi:hypothetical protein
LAQYPDGHTLKQYPLSSYIPVGHSEVDLNEHDPSLLSIYDELQDIQTLALEQILQFEEQLSHLKVKLFAKYAFGHVLKQLPFN